MIPKSIVTMVMFLTSRSIWNFTGGKLSKIVLSSFLSYGGLYENGPHCFLGSGNIRRHGIVVVGWLCLRKCVTGGDLMFQMLKQGPVWLFLSAGFNLKLCICVLYIQQCSQTCLMICTKKLNYKAAKHFSVCSQNIALSV